MSGLKFALRDINACKQTEICLSGRGLFSVEIQEIVDALNKKPHITQVDLSTNNLDDECIVALCKLEYIDDLDLFRNNINEGALDLVKKFKRLNLRQNFLSSETIKKLEAIDDSFVCEHIILDNSFSEIFKKINSHKKPQPTIDTNNDNSCCQISSWLKKLSC